MATTILHIDSSALGDRSVSRKLTAKVLSELKSAHPHATVVARDLAANPLPHLDGLAIGAFFTPPDQRPPVLAQAIKLSDDAVDELLKADIIVLGAPMYNFGIPSSLKAWIDHIVRAGRTFKVGPAGPQSLLPPGKKVIIVSSRGQVYTEGPYTALDHQESYLKAILGFIGLHDVSFVRAEGMATGEAASQQALKKAETQLAEAIRRATAA